MIFVLVAPFLQLGRRVALGNWQLIPRTALTADDCVSPEALAQVQGLFDLYHAPPRGRQGCGCVLSQGQRRVGEPFPRSQMRPLRRALVAALLDANPTLDGRSDDPNVGHRVATSDNAALYGHRVAPDNYVTVDYGAMVTTLAGGLRIGEHAHAIQPPNELTLPLLGPAVDDVYADALYRCLMPRTDAARRLGTAIDWLDLAWRNTPSTSAETRVVQLKFGFEVLLDRGDKLEAQRPVLDTLLADLRGGRRMRHYVTLRGMQRSEVMSDLGWWFTKFTWLRNCIAHGDEIAAGDHRFGRAHHLWLGEARLRAALKRTVAAAGGTRTYYSMSGNASLGGSEKR